jgi:hypothetical protein
LGRYVNPEITPFDNHGKTHPNFLMWCPPSEREKFVPDDLQVNSALDTQKMGEENGCSEK